MYIHFYGDKSILEASTEREKDFVRVYSALILKYDGGVLIADAQTEALELMYDAEIYCCLEDIDHTLDSDIVVRLETCRKKPA